MKRSKDEGFIEWYGQRIPNATDERRLRGLRPYPKWKDDLGILAGVAVICLIIFFISAALL
ncbi:hypothetical protein UFOVP1299_53 [uncultured Caudovirales phage]|uniref:Uncharacterized protein n=1 Tax=uncultured Caudovirales phage TaxID=2100421 RepID=A0A6J5RFM7_9CAUD|nr:hypothetical protein UFOVP1299_53 [uncultured Caudovirales phage]